MQRQKKREKVNGGRQKRERVKRDRRDRQKQTQQDGDTRDRQKGTEERKSIGIEREYKESIYIYRERERV